MFGFHSNYFFLGLCNPFLRVCSSEMLANTHERWQCILSFHLTFAQRNHLASLPFIIASQDWGCNCCYVPLSPCMATKRAFPLFSRLFSRPFHRVFLTNYIVVHILSKNSDEEKGSLGKYLWKFYVLFYDRREIVCEWWGLSFFHLFIVDNWIRY